MSIFGSINVSATGLTAERLRMDIISKNIANAETTRTSAGTPYRRQVPVFQEQQSRTFADVLKEAQGQEVSGNGVEVAAIKDDTAPFKRVYNPGHPDADQEGYVLMPNVEVVTEMIDLISASRGFEANVTAMNATKSMVMKAMEIGK